MSGSNDQSSKTLSDEELLAGHLAGEPGRFEQLVRRHNRELYHFLVRFTGNRAAAEDLVQEAFLQVHVSAAGFDLSRRFRPWLFAIAANKARDMMRWRSRRPELPLEGGSSGSDESGGSLLELLSGQDRDPSDCLAEQEHQQLVREVVEQMPDHLREALILGYYHRLAYKEIAEILAIPLGTVKSRLHAAVGHFAREWQARIEQRTSGGSEP